MLERIKNLFGYTQSSLAKEILQIASSIGYTGKVDYDEQSETIVFANQSKLSLSSVYLDIKHLDAKTRRQQLYHLVQSLITPSLPETWEDAASHILPRIRPLSLLAMRSHHLEIKGSHYEYLPDEDYLPLCSSLAMEFVLDTEYDIRSLDKASFQKWQVTLEEIKKQAISNLYRLSEEPFQSVNEGLWHSPWQDNHDNARLLLTEKLSDSNIKGDAVLLIPHRDLLLIADSHNDAAVQQACELAEQQAEHHRYTTLHPYIWHEESLIEYHPHNESQQYPCVKRLHTKAHIADYEEQKPVLENWLAQQGEDYFVANYSAVQTKDGDIFTYATWSEGVPSYLPKTDLIALVAEKDGVPSDTLGLVPWHMIALRCPHRLTEVPGWHPLRYQVNSFPSAEEIQDLPMTQPG